MEQNIFDEYNRTLKQKDVILKELEQKKAELIKYYDDTIKSTKKHFEDTLLNLQSKIFEDINKEFDGEFEICLSRLKKHISGENGYVDFSLPTNLPHLTNPSIYLKLLKNTPLWITFSDTNQKRNWSPSFRIKFNPDQKLINGATLGDMVAYVENNSSGGISPKIVRHTEELMTINSSEIEKLAKDEFGYGNYNVVKSILSAVREEKEIQNKFSKEEERIK